VRISGATSADVHVTEHKSYLGTPPVSTHAVSKGVLTLTYTCPSSASGCGVDYTVQVRSGVAVQAIDSAGNITLSKLGGDLQLQDSAGDIQATALTSTHAKVDDDAGEITASFSTVPVNLYADDQAGDVPCHIAPHEDEGMMVGFLVEEA
jgi:hypothetical protein